MKKKGEFMKKILVSLILFALIIVGYFILADNKKEDNKKIRVGDATITSRSYIKS